MGRKIYFILTCIFFVFGCASTQNQSRFSENTFFSENPKLKVQILKEVLKQEEKSQQGIGYISTRNIYITGADEAVGILIWRFRHASNTSWQSSDEELMRQVGLLPLDPIIINNKTWVKFVQLNKEKHTVFGYFKRMDNNLVAVYGLIRADQHYNNDIESFAKSRVLNERLKSLITETFGNIEKLFIIG